MCRSCGVLGRRDNLKTWHFPYCQPNLPAGDSGFLEIGETPECGAEEVLAVLDRTSSHARRLGVPSPPTKDPEQTVTESEGETAGQNNAKPGRKNPSDTESLVSFGKKKARKGP